MKGITLLFCLSLLAIVGCSNNKSHTDSKTNSAHEEHQHSGFKGYLRVQYAENFETGYFKKSYYLEDESTNKLIEISIDQIKNLPNDGSYVLIEGDVHNNVLQAKSISLENDPHIHLQKIDAGGYKGVRKVAAIQVTWKGSSPCSSSTIASAMNTVNGIYQELSEGTFGFDAELIGPYELNAETQPSLTQVLLQMIEKMEADGISPARYQHFSLYLPSNWSATWAGVGSTTYTAMKSCGTRVIAHELGHALGLAHASKGEAEYGDASNFMGGHYNRLHAQHLEWLGWMDSTLEVSNSGVYEIGLLELKEGQTTLPQALKIKKPASESQYTYFSYRNDPNISDTFNNKLNVHSLTGGTWTHLLGTYDVGSTYTDSTNGISVKVLSRTSTSMSVQVDLTCVRAAPELITSTSATGRIGAVRATATFAAKNRDSIGCQNTSQVNLYAEASHPGIKVDIARDNSDLIPGETLSTRWAYYVDKTVPEGSYTVTLRATTSSGKTTSKTVPFTVSGVLANPWDTSFSVSLDGSSFNNQTLTPGTEIEFAPTITGVNSVRVNIHNGTTTDYVHCYPGQACTWTIPDVLDTGYLIYARAQKDGNYQYSNFLSVQTPSIIKNDINPPFVQISSHNRRMYVPIGATLNVQALASDNVGIDRVEFEETIRSTNKRTILCTDTTITYDCAWTVDGNVGDELWLRPIAYDTSGNISQASPLVIKLVAPVDNLDITPPQIAFTNPQNNSDVSGTVQLSADASDDKGITQVKFYANGELIGTDTTAPYSINWDTTNDFDGSFQLRARAIDVGLNATDAIIYVNTVNGIYDEEPPTLSITSPSDGSLVGANNISIRATATDNVLVSQVEFYIDGVKFSTDSSSPYSASWDASGATEGNHTLTVRAIDNSNNYTDQSITLYVDPVKPFVHINTPGDGNKVGTGVTVNITATASDNRSVENVRFRVNGSTVCTDSNAPYSCSWSVPNSPGKDYRVEAMATDDAGNISTSIVNVISEKGAGDGGSNDPPGEDTPPSLTITAPSNSSTVSGTVLIEATASDDKGIVTVKFYINDELVKTDTTNPYNYSWDTTQTANSSTALRVVASDTVNQTAEQSITVNVNNDSPEPPPEPPADTEAPIVAITSPTDGASFNGGSNISLQASASDNVAVSNVKFYIDGSLICTDSTASYSCSWKMPKAKNKYYRIQAVATDSSGNTSSDVISISSGGSSDGGGKPGGGGDKPCRGKKCN